MHQAHGIGYKDYCQKLDERMRIEECRERDYKKSLTIVAQIHRIIQR